MVIQLTTDLDRRHEREREARTRGVCKMDIKKYNKSQIWTILTNLIKLEASKQTLTRPFLEEIGATSAQN
jgi:hypothetical protein